MMVRLFECGKAKRARGEEFRENDSGIVWGYFSIPRCHDDAGFMRRNACGQDWDHPFTFDRETSS